MSDKGEDDVNQDDTRSVDGTDAARSALQTAFAAGQQFSAHVDALHVSADPKDAVPLLGEGMSGAMIEEMIQYAEKEAAERAASGRRMFDEQCARDSVSVSTMPPAAETFPPHGSKSSAAITRLSRRAGGWPISSSPGARRRMPIRPRPWS